MQTREDLKDWQEFEAFVFGESELGLGVTDNKAIPHRTHNTSHNRTLHTTQTNLQGGLND